MLSNEEFQQLIIAKFDRFEAKLDEHGRDIKDLKAGFVRLEAKVDRLEAKVDKLEAKVDKLEAKVDNLEAKGDNLEAKVGKLEVDVDKLKVEVDKLKVEVDKLTVEVDKLKDSVNYLQREHADHVDLTKTLINEVGTLGEKHRRHDKAFEYLRDFSKFA